jgi:hypothetical protein
MSGGLLITGKKIFYKINEKKTERDYGNGEIHVFNLPILIKTPFNSRKMGLMLLFPVS